MARINELMDELLQDFPLREVLEHGHSLVEALPLAIMLRPVQEYHLLEGLLFAQARQFFTRMKVASDQKQSLAAYAYKNCGLEAEVKRFPNQGNFSSCRSFFESGSTIAHLIGRYAGELSRVQNRLVKGHTVSADRPLLKSTVMTNNFTGTTALAGLVEQLEPVQGRLCLKYFGFFPFPDEPSTLTPQEEVRRFNQLVEDIKSCHAVFATCSSFSFLAGPLVGLRGNCLTKRAMYSGAALWDSTSTQKFYLLFHFEKLFPLIYADTSLKFDKPNKHCKPVFMAMHENRISAGLEQWLHGHCDRDVINKDNFQASWHANWQERLKTGTSPTITVPLEGFLDAANARRLNITHNLQASWLNWIGSVNGANVLIALPTKSAPAALEWLKTELNRVNTIIAMAECKFSYKLCNADDAVKDLVAHIVVERI